MASIYGTTSGKLCRSATWPAARVVTLIWRGCCPNIALCNTSTGELRQRRKFIFSLSGGERIIATAAMPSIKSMASGCDISIVIPVFNEAATLGMLLGKVQALRLSRTEIIVVDDGSADESAEIALSAGASVIRHPYN